MFQCEVSAHHMEFTPHLNITMDTRGQGEYVEIGIVNLMYPIKLFALNCWDFCESPSSLLLFFHDHYFISWNLWLMLSLIYTSALKMRNFQQSNCYELPLRMEAIMCLPQNQHYSWWAKMNGIQRKALVSPWRMHWMYSGIAKGTSWVEVTSNSKKNQALADGLGHCRVTQTWRHQSAKQLVNQSVENSINTFVLKFRSNFWKRFGSIWRLVWL